MGSDARPAFRFAVDSPFVFWRLREVSIGSAAGSTAGRLLPFSDSIAVLLKPAGIALLLTSGLAMRKANLIPIHRKLTSAGRTLSDTSLVFRPLRSQLSSLNVLHAARSGLGKAFRRKVIVHSPVESAVSCRSRQQPLTFRLRCLLTLTVRWLIHFLGKE